jgi:ribosomal protein S18 acetylase RimI-like enzyme
MEIRKLTINDYEEIYELWMSTPGMGLNDIDDSKSGIDKYMKRNPNTCFVAVVSGKIVGVILSGHDGRRGYIHHTAVSITSRNKGIGSALIDTALKALKDEGIHKVALVVFKGNDIGNTFWEQKGFGTREDLSYRNKALTDLKSIDT